MRLTQDAVRVYDESRALALRDRQLAYPQLTGDNFEAALAYYRRRLRYHRDRLLGKAASPGDAITAADHRCPACGGALDIHHEVAVDEPYLAGQLLREAPLPRRQRTATAVAFCTGCEYCVELTPEKGLE